jgi:DNA processing protein
VGDPPATGPVPPRPSTAGAPATSGSPLPDVAWLLALAGLDAMAPSRLRTLTRDRPAVDAWDEITAGSADRGPLAGRLGPEAATRAARWAAHARRVDVAHVWDRHVEAGVGVAGWRSLGFPPVLADDPEPPAVLVWAGTLDALAGPRVAVVGTRDCSRGGRDVAFELGRDLAASGVRVVSGLALGIDGAAHAGALEAHGAAPVAVVGSGLDVVYPRRNAALWRRVAATGVVLSEYPLGTPAAPWRFPARNRLIAALADVVVVVESHDAGGALITVEEAQRRDRDVMAVPGSVRSPASRGTNQLLLEGAQVCRDADDVLTLLGLDGAASTRRGPDRPAPSGVAALVLDAVGWQPAAPEELLLRTGLSLGDLATHLDRLEEDGWVIRRGGWYERLVDG